MLQFAYLSINAELSMLLYSQLCFAFNLSIELYLKISPLLRSQICRSSFSDLVTVFIGLATRNESSAVHTFTLARNSLYISFSFIEKVHIFSGFFLWGGGSRQYLLQTAGL